MRTKIEIRNISKAFASDKGPLQVVDGVDFKVGDGEFVAIIGPSGCGKTTLMNMVAGFLRPDRGSVIIDGVERHSPSSHHIATCPVPLADSGKPMFGLNPCYADTTADHYAAIVGERQNEAIRASCRRHVEERRLARALVVKPEILYMDEPFSAVDALMGLRIRNELLRILAEERHTVMLITHDVEEAIHLADRILVLSPRPTRIRATFDVPFPHPRKLTSPAVQELRAAVLRELGIES
jgi:ABC-type nitrate/sulfonate/bicarbonate transport system ATPase subunit